MKFIDACEKLQAALTARACCGAHRFRFGHHLSTGSTMLSAVYIAGGYTHIQLPSVPYCDSLYETREEVNKLQVQDHLM